MCAGVKNRSNVRLTLSPGRNPRVLGAEHTLDALATRLSQLRTTGVALNTADVKATTLVLFKKDGKEAVLSPHVLDPEQSADTAGFTCSNRWLMCFMKDKCNMAGRCSTKAVQVTPWNDEHWKEECFQRLCFLCKFDVPASHVVMADETFVTYRPDCKCAPSFATRVYATFLLVLWKIRVYVVSANCCCLYRRTWETVGATEVPVTDKDEKAGDRVMVPWSDVCSLPQRRSEHVLEFSACTGSISESYSECTHHKAPISMASSVTSKPSKERSQPLCWPKTVS